MDKDLINPLSKYETPITEKVGAKQIEIASNPPSTPFHSTSEEKIKGKTFGLYLTKA